MICFLKYVLLEIVLFWAVNLAKINNNKLIDSSTLIVFVVFTPNEPIIYVSYGYYINSFWQQKCFWVLELSGVPAIIIHGIIWQTILLSELQIANWWFISCKYGILLPLYNWKTIDKTLNTLFKFHLYLVEIFRRVCLTTV